MRHLPSKGVAELVLAKKSTYRASGFFFSVVADITSLSLPTEMAIATALFSPHIGFVAGICAALLLLFLLLRPIFDPLRRVPGPFLARYTRLWLLKEVWRGTFPQTNIKLHKRYGVYHEASEHTGSAS